MGDGRQFARSPSKSPTARIDESLAKLLCHNVVVLVHEMHELGIAPQFGGGGTDEPENEMLAVIRLPSV